MSTKIVAVLAFLTIMAYPSQEQAQNFCGRKLAETLGILCENGLLLEKRSGPVLSTLYDEVVPQRWGWMSRHRAHAVAAPSRGKRSVVDECCMKPCTIDELMTYCA